jgi:hypothetical protein
MLKDSLSVYVQSIYINGGQREVDWLLNVTPDDIQGPRELRQSIVRLNVLCHQEIAHES